MKRVFRLLQIAALLWLTSCDSSAGVPQGAVQAESWLTTGDGRFKLEAQPPRTFAAGSGTRALRIVVDEGTRYQQIDGFGAALTHASAHVLQGAPGREQIMQRLFSRDQGIGISYLRLAMGASDFVHGAAYTYDDVPPGTADPALDAFSIAPDEPAILPLLKQARALHPELRLMASPWSAPAWMKTPPHLNGGSLRPEAYPTYANYFVRFVQAYARHGLPIDAVTVQNEPQHTTDSYPTMRMEPEEQAAFVRDHLGPAFRRHDLSTKILIWDHNWDQPSFPLIVLQDAGARAFIDGVAWHCYAGDVEAQGQVARAFPGVATYFTECSGGAWDSNFASVLSWNMRHLFIGAVRNEARTVLLWNLALDENGGPHNGGCDNCRGVVTVRSDGGVVYEPEYYAIGHLSAYVRPGAHRIASPSFPGQLETVAFHNPDGSKVLVVLNPGEEVQRFDVVWQDQHVAADGLPARSVITFRWDTPASE